MALRGDQGRTGPFLFRGVAGSLVGKHRDSAFEAALRLATGVARRENVAVLGVARAHREVGAVELIFAEVLEHVLRLPREVRLVLHHFRDVELSERVVRPSSDVLRRRT